MYFTVYKILKHTHYNCVGLIPYKNYGRCKMFGRLKRTTTKNSSSNEVKDCGSSGRTKDCGRSSKSCKGKTKDCN